MEDVEMPEGFGAGAEDTISLSHGSHSLLQICVRSLHTRCTDLGAYCVDCLLFIFCPRVSRDGRVESLSNPIE